MERETILAYDAAQPDLADGVYVSPGAYVIGDVKIGARSSVWFNAVVRGDEDSIQIGACTNIQDNATIHVAKGHPTRIGDQVTVGHNALIHACTVGDCCLIGMGAILLDDCEIGDRSIIAAGSVVAPRQKIPAGSMVMGTPGKVTRALTEAEVESIRRSAAHYLETAAQYMDREGKG